jgi:hypothetical protein
MEGRKALVTTMKCKNSTRQQMGHLPNRHLRFAYRILNGPQTVCALNSPARRRLGEGGWTRVSRLPLNSQLFPSQLLQCRCQPIPTLATGGYILPLRSPARSDLGLGPPLMPRASRCRSISKYPVKPSQARSNQRIEPQSNNPAIQLSIIQCTKRGRRKNLFFDRIGAQDETTSILAAVLIASAP